MCTKSFVERQQVGGQSSRQGLPLLPQLTGLGVDHSSLLITAGLGGRQLGLSLFGLAAQLHGPSLRRLAAFHDVQNDVFQVGLAAGQRADLVLEILELTRRADLAPVEAFMVASRTCPHLINVGLGLSLLAGDVALSSLRGDEEVLQLREPGRCGRDLFMLRQSSALVIELVEAGVVRLQFEQVQLVGSRGVQCCSLMRSSSRSSRRNGRTRDR